MRSTGMNALSLTYSQLVMCVQLRSLHHPVGAASVEGRQPDAAAAFTAVG